MNDGLDHPYLEVRSRNPDGSVAEVRLTACPACEEPIPGGIGAVVDHLRDEHGPEDFGLSPFGEVRGSRERERGGRGGPPVAGGLDEEPDRGPEEVWREERERRREPPVAGGGRA